MNVGIIIIGDEILNGYRQDRHFEKSIALLTARGHRLVWSQIIGDVPQRIVDTLAYVEKENIPVFCFGGIGATPDDYTRECAAKAFDLPLVIHPQAAKLIEEQFGEQAYPKRIRMAELPEGAVLIPNPVNRVPGFSVGDMHFLPGFPQMAGPMMEWVLSRYPDEIDHDRVRSVLRIKNGHESEFIDVMNEMMALDTSLSISSLPVIGREKNYIDFIIAGKRAFVVRAVELLLDCSRELQVAHEFLQHHTEIKTE